MYKRATWHPHIIIESTRAMARVEINIRFFYDDVIYADTLGYLPRQEAIKIPELKVEENMRRAFEGKTIAPREPSGKKE